MCDDEAVGRRAAAESYERYGRLVNYRRILDVEDVEGPSEVAVVGNEPSLRSQLESFADAGATDFIANIFTAGDDPELKRPHLCRPKGPGGENLAGIRIILINLA